MSIFKKILNIASAFMNPLPTEEPWYQERLKACLSCEFNSENVKQEDKSTLHLIRDVGNPCPEKSHCTICGCCIHRKTAVPAESCAIGRSKLHLEKGYKSKWETMVIEDGANRGISLIKPHGEKYGLTREGGKFFIELGETTEKTVRFTVMLAFPENYKIKNVVAGCSCTYVEIKEIESGLVEIPFKISTLTFRKNIKTDKFISIYFMDGKIQRVVNVKTQVIVTE